MSRPVARFTSPSGAEGRAGAHLDALRACGAPAAAEPGLLAYLDLLAAWSPKVNLTGARTPEDRVLTLVAPVLPLVSLVPEGRVLDLGSGNGSPGLVLALLCPSLDVTLVEPRMRRVAFLREAARATHREDVKVFRGRHDEYPGPLARTVVVRALTLPLGDLAGLLEPGGRVLILGRPPAPAPGFTQEPAEAPDLHVYRRST
jgi:16S rRNA (guanine527-N7)-methyltransferase